MIRRSMIATRNGSVRLFRLFGIDVFLHWSWAIVAAFMILRPDDYQQPIWKVIQYLSLFAIVIMHEFGHALACKSVGGRAHDIVLWPLGGVAYVSPPNRPGAYLWSIVAGPLVNVILVPVTFCAYFYGVHTGLVASHDAGLFLHRLVEINLLLLIFNILPIFPLDGGQIVRGLLWFLLGAGRSLMISAWVGVLVAGVAVLFCLWYGEYWLTIMSLFAANRCYAGIQAARAIRMLERAPTHHWLHCPGCGKSPPAGAWLRCVCNAPIDPFQSGGSCPLCGRSIDIVACPHCYQAYPLTLWQPNPVYAPPYVPPQP